MERKRQLHLGKTNMPPVEVCPKVGKPAIKCTRGKSTPPPDTAEGAHADRLSGILKLKDPKIIEEIAESDLLA